MQDPPAENSESRSSIGRRSFLATTGTALGAATLSGSAIAGTPSSRVSETISPKVAQKAAELKRRQVEGSGKFTDWVNAALGESRAFYMPVQGDASEKYVRTAYVFPVRKNGEEVGYITTSAHRSLEPILEYSTGTSPTRKLTTAETTVEQQADLSVGRPIYTGGIVYGLEVGDRQVLNLQDDSISYIGVGSPSDLQFTKTDSEHRWELVQEGTYGEDKAYATSEVAPMDENLSGVPAWTETDLGGADSTSIGTGSDSWPKWDGCTPIAASMIIGFHENVDSWQANERESIIDRLHQKMETNAEDGSTPPVEFVLNLDGSVSGPSDLVAFPMVEGIEDYTEGDNDYSATQHVNTGIEFVLAEIGQDSRPFMLNLAGGGRAEDYPPDKNPYDHHSVCVVGYNNDGTDIASELEIHDTWNSSEHILSYGNWWAHSSISVSAD